MYSLEIHKEYLERLKGRVKEMKTSAGTIGQRIPIRSVIKKPQDMKRAFIQLAVKRLFPYVKETLDDGQKFRKDKGDVKPATDV